MGGELNVNAQAVLDVVRKTENHPTATEVYHSVIAIRPTIGLASVYRILHKLVNEGHIRELRHRDESCRYDARCERHDHAICTICGALFDIPIDIPLATDLLQAAAHSTGIELDSHELRLYGRCQACRAQENTSKVV